MTELNNQNLSWTDYLGDSLRGKVPVNQLIPQHPYILDTLGVAEILEKNTQHIMLLTLEEAQGVVDDFLNSQLVKSGTTYAGNIKDSIDGVNKISKQISRADVERLIFRLKEFGINANKYHISKGLYLKITDYKSIRRILRSTRVRLNSFRHLDVSVAMTKTNVGIMSGARFCVWFSLGWRLVEFIFKSDREVVKFLGNITMDMAKIIVTVYVTKMVATIGTAAVAFGVTVPVALGAIAIVVIGLLITWSLDSLDNKYQLSDKLIAAIRQGLEARQKIEQWNLKHAGPFTSSLMNTQW